MTHATATVGEPSANTYDELPYPGAPFAQTHPGRLATIGILFGMNSPPVEQCRVLELGCARGGNLIPMAVTLPQSEFVGIDLSQRQIKEGQSTVRELELGNIRLQHLDIADVDESFGSFDYIIAHGVFSWVPREIQEKILAIASERLNPNGIAYISYNTYPGWRMRGMVRDMMLYHTRQFSETQMRIDQARALVNFLADAVPDRESPYGRLLSDELSQMKRWSDNYFFHDSLEVHNEPLYFHEFIERAGRHGLRYLGESEFAAMLTGGLSPETSSTLGEIGRDIVEMEQYMDFVRNRMFRQTLLCHADTVLDRTLTSDCCGQLCIRSLLQPASPLNDVRSTEEVDFTSPNGAIVSVSAPIQKAAFLSLAEAFPAAIHFSDLMARARSVMTRGESRLHDADELARQDESVRDAVFRCFCDNLMELSAVTNRMATTPSKAPRATPLARREVESEGYATNLLHERIHLDTLDSRILQHLDGRNDRAALLEILQTLAAEGSIVATRNGEVVEQCEDLRDLLQEQLEVRLERLARLALLTD